MILRDIGWELLTNQSTCWFIRSEIKSPSPSRFVGKGCLCLGTPHAPPPFREGFCARRQRRVSWLQRIGRATVATVAGQRRTSTGFPSFVPLASGLWGTSAVAVCDCSRSIAHQRQAVKLRSPGGPHRREQAVLGRSPSAGTSTILSAGSLGQRGPQIETHPPRPPKSASL
jgi:hypothetical protein